MRNRIIVSYCMLSFGLMANNPPEAKSQKRPDKFLKYRDGDSVWSVSQAFVYPTRFYVGETRVKFRTWRDHLEKSDRDVSTLMKKGIAKQRTSTWIGIGGLAATFGGLRMVRLNSRPWGVPNEAKQTTGYIITGVGAIATIISLGMTNKAYRLYASGERLFNNKVRQGKLQPVTFHLRAGPTQAGILVGW